jgi:hypothetical protein
MSRFESWWICDNNLNFPSGSVFSTFQAFASHIAFLEIQYLLQFSDIECAFHIDVRADLVGDRG